MSDRPKRPSQAPQGEESELFEVPIDDVEEVALDELGVGDPEVDGRSPSLAVAWGLEEDAGVADLADTGSGPDGGPPTFDSWDQPGHADTPTPTGATPVPTGPRPQTQPLGTRARPSHPPPMTTQAPADFFNELPGGDEPAWDDDALPPPTLNASDETRVQARPPEPELAWADQAAGRGVRSTAPPPEDWEVPNDAHRSRTDLRNVPPRDARPPTNPPETLDDDLPLLPIVPQATPATGQAPVGAEAALAAGSGNWQGNAPRAGRLTRDSSRPRPPTMPPPPPRPGTTPPRAGTIPPPLRAGRESTPPAEPTIFNDANLFRQEVQRLAKSRDWQKLVAISSAALDEATWAKLPESRAALLEDQAKVYRDRLKDVSTAEEVFARLAKEQPGNAAAIEFLAERHGERGDHRAIYDLYGSAIEATWDPDQRLAWTQASVRLAEDELHSPELALGAWERLDRLGDAAEDTQRALSAGYRHAQKWDKLAEFLLRRADKQTGADKVVTLREVAEAYLTGLRDQGKARDVLEQIIALRPGDAVSLLALARVLAGKKQWDDLSALSRRAAELPHKGAALDFHRLVADAMWTAGELDRAIVAHEQVLVLAPEDAGALKAKEQYLERTSRHAELVEFLAGRAAVESGEDERLSLLARAAKLAENEVGDPTRAIALWEQQAEVPAGKLDAARALERLYARISDHPGVARALENQLVLVRDRQGRIELLRRLGDHAAHRQKDDVRAESAWKELLSLAPEDRAATEELSALQRRRGDFEGLDRTLTAQGWHASDESAALALWRAAAGNVEDHLRDPVRGAAAWQRVLDLAPDDAEALAALDRHRRQGGGTPAVFALEARLRATSDDSVRVDLALELGDLHEKSGDRAGALAAFERVLVWRPRHEGALAALSRLHGGTSPGVAQGAFDAAAAATDSPADHLQLAERSSALIPENDKRGRFFAARRLLWLSGRDAGAEKALTKAATDAEAWSDLAAVLELLGADETGAARAQRLQEIAALVDERLGNKPRAFVTLQEIGQDPTVVAAALPQLAELAKATGRHEDHLALLDVVARAGASLEDRRTALRERARVCEHELKDAERAFHEQVRLLSLDPQDATALAEAKRLAAARALWHKLDALYVELTDRASGPAARAALLVERHGVHAVRLENPDSALDLQLARYRLEPEGAGLADAVVSGAKAQKAWDRVLPLIEGRVRASGAAASASELARLAGLHEHERKDTARAFELYAASFVMDPDKTEVETEITRLADKLGAHEILAVTLRTGAARTADPGRRLALLRKVAAIHGETLGQAAQALDVHRRILQLASGEMASLEVIIDRERERQAWQPLREALTRWAELTRPAAGTDLKKKEREKRIGRLLEIAQISREHLADPDSALSTYGELLELDPSSEAAIAGVRSLTEGQDDPVLEGRRLRLQLARASGEARIELQLALAKLHEEQLADLPAAVLVLESLVAESGPAGPGFEPLARLLRQEKNWQALLDLHEARAQALGDKHARVEALRGLIALAELHPAADAAARLERLCQRLLDEHAADEEGSTRLKTLYRATGRHAELAAVLERQLAALPAPEADDKDAKDDSAAERALLEDELARLYDCGLGRLADAERIQIARLARTPDDRSLLPALASLRLRQDDFAGYVTRRTEAARQQAGAIGALILCHLAEASDERGEAQQKVADLYREARQLDAQCAPANEALKAIGRRSKNWRQSAALLADADEATLKWPERATRLKTKGDALTASDPAAAEQLYLRAVAIDPDHYVAWDALADLATARDDAEAARAYQYAALGAYERSCPPEPKRLGEHAERIQRLAASRAAAGDAEAAARWSRRAFELSPSSASAALAVADLRLTGGDHDGALQVYDRVLSDRDQLAPIERLHALYQRGILSARLGKLDAAIADLRDTLRLEPLHAGALNALADALADAGRDAAAIQHYTQSLLVATDDRQRGRLLARLAHIWETRVGVADEANACVERALSLDPEDRTLLARGLKMYAQSGRGAQALAVIEKLLPGATDPKELASLWTSRGDLLSDGEPERAIEAFDMALSYDPGAPTALAGLAKLLEARGEWAQLLDIFEARTESGAPEERASALRQLARIAGDRLNDAPRAEKYLKQAIELAPEPADYEQLLSLYGDDPKRERERRDVIAGLLATSGPWAARLGDLGRRLAEAGDRRLAWCLTSPLAGFSIPDQALKGLVLELRKELEKADNVEALAPDLHERVRPAQLPDRLLALLAEIDTQAVLGPATLDDVGAQAAGKADARTALGKTFATLAERVGLPGATLYRAGTLPGVPLRVLDGEIPTVVVRSELLQLLPLPEINLLFVTLLELTRPGARLVAALSAEEAAALLPAILAAAPGAPESSDPEVAAFAARLRGAADDQSRASWAQRLGEISEVSGDGGQSLGRRLQALVWDTARRVALVGTPDLRTAARLLTRLDEAGPKQPSGGPLSELDTFIAQMPALKALIGYAASVEFGRVLAGM